MNEIVRFTSDTGQEVQITPQDIKAYICKDATDNEVGLFLELCKAQRLNPFVRDAYLVKYGSAPATIITGKEVFTKRANANKKYQGFEAGVTYMNARGEVCQREGSAVYKAAKEQLVGGWCRVFVEGRKPFYDEVTLEEYSTGKSGWAKMPATMIRKVALVHCLREAFPDDFQGLYAAEEMGNAGSVPPPDVPEMPARKTDDKNVHVIDVAELEFVEMVSDAQAARIDELAARFGELRDRDRSEVFDALMTCKTLKEAGVVQGEVLTAEQADKAISVLEGWIAKAGAAG